MNWHTFCDTGAILSFGSCLLSAIISRGCIVRQRLGSSGPGISYFNLSHLGALAYFRFKRRRLVMHNLALSSFAINRTLWLLLRGEDSTIKQLSTLMGSDQSSRSWLSDRLLLQCSWHAAHLSPSCSFHSYVWMSILVRYRAHHSSSGMNLVLSQFVSSSTYLHSYLTLRNQYY